MTNDIAWEPSEYYVTGSYVARFRREYGFTEDRSLRPSTEAELAEQWGAFEEDTGMVWQETYDDVVDIDDGAPWAKWFTDGRLNAVETILDRWVERTPNAAMYRWEDEDGRKETVTYQEMHDRSNRLANAFHDRGLGAGDVVGIIGPLHPNGFAAALATLRVGATFVMVFPGYGGDAIARRLADAEASILVTADGIRRGGTVQKLLPKVERAVEATPSLDEVVVFDHTGLGATLSGVRQTDWDALLAGYGTTTETAKMRSDDTAFLAYSSGTTGRPKGTIHTHASLLAMGNKEAKYHFDLGEGDTLLWVTDFGWIIVPIWMLAGAPALGATTVLLDGNLMTPSADRVWRAIEEYEVTTFGIAPTGAGKLRRETPDPAADFDLSSLRIYGSTGEPWNEENWLWLLDTRDREVPIINASGGTELAGAILAPTPDVPLKPGTLYGPAPGIAANIYDESGTPTDRGYLVVELPIPGMTHGLTAGDERYLAEYWSDFEDAWNQNDWASRDEDGFWFITGRADDTMNISGRRITAPELERVIARHPSVAEVAVVSVPADAGGRTPIAFVVPSPTTELSAADLEGEVRTLVAENLGAPFRPSRVHLVDALPRTQTGKIPRSVLESAYIGEEVEDADTLADADVLERFPSQGGG